MSRCQPLAILLAMCFAPAVVADPQMELGRQVFTELAQPSCTICHTLADAGSTGQVGPNLDQLAPTEEQVRLAVTDGVGVMPAFEEALSEQQIAAVAHYVARISGQ